MEMKLVEEAIKERLQMLRTFTSTPGHGVTRLPFSNEARRAADYLKEEMEKAGLTSVWMDAVGNVRGRLEADEPETQTIMMGSHYDTVKNGGAYDGIAGVVCAIETAKAIKRSGMHRRYALEIIAFNDEEGMMFGSGCLGSKALMGMVDQNDIRRLNDENGISIEEWMHRWGSRPEEIPALALDADQIRAFFEIHIEQGPVLDAGGKEIGIVDCIVGLLRCMVTVRGRADHAGTTPMHMRRDAIGIASKVISQLDQLADSQDNGSVATCGFIRAYPNAMNVIAETCEFTMDLRSREEESIERMMAEAETILKDCCAETGAGYEVDIKLRQKPVAMSRPIMDILCETCRENEYSFQKMISGAAHDSMIFADKTETAMVFVPSREGRSHCPQEYSEYGHLAKAVKIVYETIVKMNQE